MLFQKSALLFQAQAEAYIHSDFQDIPIQMKFLFMHQFLAKSQAIHQESSYAVFKNPAIRDGWRDSLNEAVRDDFIRRLSKTSCEGF